MKDNLARVEAGEEPPSEIDTLIADLEAGRVGYIPLPDEVTSPIEEVPIEPELPKWANEKRKGGVPKFFKHEVLAIREDDRPIGEIAETWGCAFDTILRVRQQGRFKDVPYVARDEIEVVDGVPQRVIMRDFSMVGSKKGRPFKSGRREPLTKEEMVAIAQDPRHSHQVAAEYMISRAYVAKIRREMGTTLLHRVPLTDGIIAQIEADPGGYEDIALKYRVPTALVKWIKGVT